MEKKKNPFSLYFIICIDTEFSNILELKYDIHTFTLLAELLIKARFFSILQFFFKTNLVQEFK